MDDYQQLKRKPKFILEVITVLHPVFLIEDFPKKEFPPIPKYG